MTRPQLIRPDGLRVIHGGLSKTGVLGAARGALSAARPELPTPERPPFTSLIDAKQAARLLGVPYTWLLAQARARQIPHHRLGHYVRFDPHDLSDWLQETKINPRR